MVHITPGCPLPEDGPVAILVTRTTRSPTDRIDRIRSRIGRQNPPTKSLAWENTGQNYNQSAFRNPGVTDS